MTTKRFIFTTRKRDPLTVGIDAPTLAEAVRVYRRLRPGQTIAWVTTDPKRRFSSAVWLVNKS